MARAEGIDAVIGKHRVDAIVAPTAGPAWLIAQVNRDHDTGGSTTPAAVAGYPHLTVQAGFVRIAGGISFFPTPLSRQVKARHRPNVLATIGQG
ncbi:MAG: hypothetical protein ACLQU1_07435 [Bryobacteraceae bacterium]